jgi:hypothetical protein
VVVRHREFRLGNGAAPKLQLEGCPNQAPLDLEGNSIVKQPVEWSGRRPAITIDPFLKPR